MKMVQHRILIYLSERLTLKIPAKILAENPDMQDNP